MTKEVCVLHLLPNELNLFLASLSSWLLSFKKTKLRSYNKISEWAVKILFIFLHPQLTLPSIQTKWRSHLAAVSTQAEWKVSLWVMGMGRDFYIDKWNCWQIDRATRWVKKYNNFKLTNEEYMYFLTIENIIGCEDTSMVCLQS